MTPLRIFISSVQKEFTREREALRDYLQGDPLMRRFFEVFLFEDAPASNRRPDDLYLEEVERCDIYVGLFGNDYGIEDEDGLSPTEREFVRATARAAHRLIFVKETDNSARHPKMRALIGQAQVGLIRKRFNTPEELVTGLYAALVEYLEIKELIRWGPFDAAPCTGAALDDLEFGRMTQFIRMARRARQFPLTEDAPPEELLEHLNLMKDGRLTNAAVLLFGKASQRFLISSEVKCAHFHGTEVAKPIPSYQVYKGTVFDLVDQAVDFVLSKIALSVGTRAEGVQAPVTYEIPKEIVIEAIVNAVAHRDYTSKGSVQVMLFEDRLEVWNPGRLAPPLTLEKLRVPHASVPGNPLLAESLYLAEYIERMGTGTLDMIRRCVKAGLPEPEFAITDGFVTTVRRTPTPIWIVRAHCDSETVANLDILVLSSNKNWNRSRTDENGNAVIKLNSIDLPVTVLTAAKGVTAWIGYNEDWPPGEIIGLYLEPLAGGGSIIFPDATGSLPGLQGRLKIHDTLDGTYLHASNIAINGGQPQPVRCVSGEELRLTDADGNELLARIVDVIGRSALVEYRATQGQSGREPELRPESRPELRPESLEAKVLTLLAGRSMSKAELSKNLGQKEISGQLNKVVRLLLVDRMIEYTLPGKPRSRLQKYRLTAKGKAAVASLRPGGADL